jgi:hypothetical protein
VAYGDLERRSDPGKNSVNSTLLEALRLERIVAVRLHPYVQVGYESVHLCLASGRTLAFEASELHDVSFDAYSIDVKEAQSSSKPQRAIQYSRSQMRVVHADIFRRAEWEESEPPVYSTIGSNPVSITAGPVGSAPPGVASITVVSGVALWCADIDSSILITLNDFPGLVNFGKGADEIDEYRSEASIESLW